MAGEFPKDFPLLEGLTPFTKIFSQNSEGDFHIPLSAFLEWLRVEGIDIAISEDEGNILEEREDGLFVPPFEESTFNPTVDDSIDFTENETNSHEPTMAVNISAFPENALQKITTGPDETKGLFVQSQSNVVVSIPAGTTTTTVALATWQKLGAIPNISYYNEDGEQLNVTAHKFDAMPEPTECVFDFGAATTFNIYVLLS